MKLSEIVENFERGAFEAWYVKELPYEDTLMWSNVLGTYLISWQHLMFKAWKARAAQVSHCRGVSSPTCDYLAPCNAVCDKCGKKH